MSNPTSNIIDISRAESVSIDIASFYYSSDRLQTVLITVLDYINAQSDIILPYFAELKSSKWQQQPKELGIYITDMSEGRALNLDARGKDYATNILSYPSDLPLFILDEMSSIPLGELVICHEVVVRQAEEQHKTVQDHITHLLVHGILHLLGFDHELGQAEQDDMESFEIEILAKLGVANPYIAK